MTPYHAILSISVTQALRLTHIVIHYINIAIFETRYLIITSEKTRCLKTFGKRRKQHSAFDEFM